MVIAELQDGKPTPKVVLEVVRRLEQGEVLLLPTDTVYGLHALANNERAVNRIKRIKGLEEDRPLSTLYASVVDVSRFVRLPEGELKRRVLESWPGPVTWVLPAQPVIPRHLLGTGKTLGIRIPDNQFLRSVCAALDGMIVSTSANYHNEVPATKREDLNKELLDELDALVFQTTPLAGRPSEVMRWTPTGPEVLRSRQMLDPHKERMNILVICSANICRSPMGEAILRKKLEKDHTGRFVIRSAGVMATDGMKASMPAVEAMSERGLHIQNHRSRMVDAELMEWADVVLTMTSDHLGELYDAFPDYKEKVFLFGAFPKTNVDEEYDVEDPYGMSIERYREVADTLEKDAEKILRNLEGIL